jgi:hypothetical protein
MEKTKKLAIDVTIDYLGFTDYYSGHGHAFADKDLVACIRFGFPVTYRETAEELADAIFEDIVTSWNLDIFSGEDIDNIESEDIKKAIEEEVANIDFNYYHAFADELRSDQEDEDDPMQEYPMMIGYMHIYKTA